MAIGDITRVTDTLSQAAERATNAVTDAANEQVNRVVDSSPELSRWRDNFDQFTAWIGGILEGWLASLRTNNPELAQFLAPEPAPATPAPETPANPTAARDQAAGAAPTETQVAGGETPAAGEPTALARVTRQPPRNILS